MRPPPGALAFLLIGAGILHFTQPRFFDSMIPRAFPRRWRRPLTYSSGAAEIVIGAMVAVPATRRRGATLASLLFLAILPANIEAARLGGYRVAPGWLSSPAAAWARVPLQIPLVLWARAVARNS